MKSGTEQLEIDKKQQIIQTYFILKIQVNYTSDGMLGISAWPRSLYIYH